MTDVPPPAADNAPRKGRNLLISCAMLVLVVLVFSVSVILVSMADTVKRDHEHHAPPATKEAVQAANTSVAGAGIS